jgi:hypothetical protein
MALPHFTQIQSHRDKWEPVYTNLFEITFTLPSALSTRSNTLLLENATSISLPTQPAVSPHTQKFKFSTRKFVGHPTSTSMENITIKFNMNQDDKKSVFVWNTLKAWYDLVWNNETGETQYKKNIVGEITVNQHDRKGEIIRRVTMYNVQILSVGEQQLAWESDGIATVDGTFMCDYWQDLYIDNL